MNGNFLISKIFILRKLQKRNNTRLSSTLFDTTSLGDIAFLLFIFFIVTSSFILREGIFLTLPPSRAQIMPLSQENVLEVVPQNEGFRVGNKILSRDALAEELRRFNKMGNDKVILIRMPLQVKYERLVDALSVAREVGIRKVSLQNEGGKN